MQWLSIHSYTKSKRNHTQNSGDSVVGHLAVSFDKKILKLIPPKPSQGLKSVV